LAEKKQDFTTKFICLSNFKDSLNTTPKFLTHGFTQEDRPPKSASGRVEESEGLLK